MAPLPSHSFSTPSERAVNTVLDHLTSNLSPAPHSPSTSSHQITTRSDQSITNSISSLLKRQTIVAIPTTYANLNSGPKPGVVVGIVLGSVGGFLLILWLLYTCMTLGNRGSTEVVEEVITRRRSRSPPRRTSTRRAPSRRSSFERSEVIEVSRHRSPAPPPPRQEVRRETIVVEERRPRPAPPPVEREDDIVEVIEEHSPTPPRRDSRSRRDSGYRTVDPRAFGGGDRPLRQVGRRG